jgi:hypothetical protein
VEAQERVIGDGVRLNRAIPNPEDEPETPPSCARRWTAMSELSCELVEYHTHLLLTIPEEPRKDSSKQYVAHVHIKYQGAALSVARPIRLLPLPRDPITGAPAI